MEEVIISLQVKSQRNRQSLTALLTSMPGVQVSAGRSLPRGRQNGALITDILLFEGSVSNAEHIAAIRRARQAQPGLKTILLVESAPLDSAAHPDEVDLILPVNATAGELFYSIDHLTAR